MGTPARVAFLKGCRTPERARNGVKTALEFIGGMESIVSPGQRVLLKPNVVAPLQKAVTSFDVIVAVVEEVKRCGGIPIIAESAGFEFDTAETFNVLGLPALAQSLDVRLVNLDEEVFQEVAFPGHPFIKTVLLPKLLFQVDVFINLPKLKQHKITDVTFGLKNLIGLPHRSSRRKMHAFGLSKAIVCLNRIIHSDITIVDGTQTLSSAAYGDAKPLGFIIAGREVTAVDRFCCELLGRDFSEVGYIEAACRGQVSDVDQEPIELVGDAPPHLAKRTQPKFLPNALYKQLCQLMHLSDVVFSRVFDGKSLIPWVNYYLGVRPVLIPERSGSCTECAALCPVNAIDLKRKRIITKRCMTVRCMRCVELCPHGAFKVKIGNPLLPSRQG